MTSGGTPVGYLCPDCKSMVVRCDRCGKWLQEVDGWKVLTSEGVTTGYVCTNCQTPEESAEAEVKLAALDYSFDSKS